MDESNPAALLAAGYELGLHRHPLTGDNILVYWTHRTSIWHRNYLLDKKARNFGFFRRLFYEAMFYGYLEYTK
jgi:hypothetical protein